MNPHKKLIYSNKITSFFCNPIIKLLGIRVSSNINRENLPANKNYLFVSNHLSYLDIFILSSYCPAVFIASVDQVKSNPILGKATELSGSLFVDRQNRGNIQEELQTIKSAFSMGANLVLFPEGTTSNGEKVLQFKSSFLALAENNSIDVLPLAIKYKKINDNPVNSDNRDYIYYYGDMSFFPHFFRFLYIKSIDVELNFLDVIVSDTNYSRKELALHTYSAISSAYAQ